MSILVGQRQRVQQNLRLNHVDLHAPVHAVEGHLPCVVGVVLDQRLRHVEHIYVVEPSAAGLAVEVRPHVLVEVAHVLGHLRSEVRLHALVSAHPPVRARVWWGNLSSPLIPIRLLQLAQPVGGVQVGLVHHRVVHGNHPVVQRVITVAHQHDAALLLRTLHLRPSSICRPWRPEKICHELDAVVAEPVVRGAIAHLAALLVLELLPVPALLLGVELLRQRAELEVPSQSNEQGLEDVAQVAVAAEENLPHPLAHQ
mmetsp:Transcript_5209/g.11378  ORF Transcript_5209/g.11378 Transcript_5209/m.11378 type:complete len:256 (+) Transcript_5209:245-1012(+)